MGKVVLGLTLSLDGYIDDQHGRVDRLFADLTDVAFRVIQ